MIFRKALTLITGARDMKIFYFPSFHASIFNKAFSVRSFLIFTH